MERNMRRYEIINLSFITPKSINTRDVSFDLMFCRHYKSIEAIKSTLLHSTCGRVYSSWGRASSLQEFKPQQ